MSTLTPEQLRTKKIAVLGYGLNNKALVAHLISLGCALTIRDSDLVKEAEFSAAFSEVEGVDFEIMPQILDNLKGFDVVFRSPGIPSDHQMLLKFVKQGGIVTSQTQFFLERCPCKVIGITGTKGKGTTSTLIYQILQAGYSEGSVYLAGNIGLDPVEFLPKLQEKDLMILELSSFQLEDVTISPHIAVVLHVTQEHLDHHQSISDYKTAKARILEFQHKHDIAIINGDYADMDFFVGKVHGSIMRYYRHRSGRQAAWVDNQEGREIVFYQVGETLDSFEITGRLLLGEHNLENILPAVLVGALFEIPGSVMASAIKNFEGLLHRLSPVQNAAGILAYDDSIATTPESCAVALEAMPAHVPLHLFAGGRDKGADFTDIAQKMVARCETITLLPGKATQLLHAALKKALKHHPEYMCTILEAHGETAQICMEQALQQLASHLKEGDIVLLSPAAASGEPFGEYKLRGNSFAAAIGQLKKEQS